MNAKEENTSLEISHWSGNKELKIAYSSVYKYDLPPGHRFPMEKYELIPEQLLYEGTIEPSQFFHPVPLSREEILLTHEVGYLDKLEQLTLSRKEVRDIGFPLKRSLVERGKYIAHGTYECAIYALKNGVSLNVAGGTHHAFAGKGEGFCLFNDIAIASNLLLSRKLAHKILIIDLDVHQGNGTANIFKDRNNVFTFSIHGERNYPLRKETSDLDIGMPDGCQGKEYLDVLYQHLPTIIDEFQPDMVFYLSGVDVLESDKLGRLSLTKADCKSRDLYVFNLCKSNKLPVAVSMGGGYSVRVADIVDAHCNTFRAALDVFF